MGFVSQAVGDVTRTVGNVIKGAEHLVGLSPKPVAPPTPPAPANPAITANASTAAGTARKAAGVASASGTVATSPEGLSEPPKTAGVTLLGGGQ